MSLKAEVTLTWGDGTYLFALKAAQIEELQRLCGKSGFGEIYGRAMTGRWAWGDLYHSIRLGLIGGGMGAVEAKELVDFYVGNEAGENRVPIAAGPNSPLSVAQAVLSATMIGVDDIEVKKKTEGTETDGSMSPDTEPLSSMPE